MKVRRYDLRMGQFRRVEASFDPATGLVTLATPAPRTRRVIVEWTGELGEAVKVYVATSPRAKRRDA